MQLFLVRLFLIITIFVLTFANVLPIVAAPDEQQNLLTNPGFDSTFDNGVATGWIGWSRDPESPAYPESCKGIPTRTPAPSATPASCQPYRKPEFRDSLSSGNRIHSGANAQKISTSSAVFDGGVYQQVTGVIIGQKYRFTAYMNGSTSTPSSQPSMGMQVGVDPNGGTDPLSAGIVWGAPGSSLDAWQLFGVDVTAKSSTITLLIRAAPKVAQQRNEVFMDDASLFAIFSSSEPLQSATGTPASTSITSETSTPTATIKVTPTWPPTSTPRANGEVWYTVRSGDTLVVIAFYHKVSVDSIKQLNGLASNSIVPGQRLLITVLPTPPPATATPATPLPTFTPSNTPELVRPPTETPRPIIIPPTFGQICVIAYNDVNNNARNDSELPMPGVRVTLSDAGNKPLDGYVTTKDAQRCFGQLTPGKYVVTVASPAGFTTTTASEFAVQVEAARSVTLVFGLAAVNRPDATTPASPVSPLMIIMFLGLATLLVIFIGIGAVVLTKKK